jgi:hypothetical protein
LKPSSIIEREDKDTSISLNGRSLLSSTDSCGIPGIPEIPRNEIWLGDQPKLIIPFRRNLEGIEFRWNGSWNFRNGI